jgi:hypothetical protein
MRHTLGGIGILELPRNILCRVANADDGWSNGLRCAPLARQHDACLATAPSKPCMLLQEVPVDSRYFETAKESGRVAVETAGMSW